MKSLSRTLVLVSLPFTIGLDACPQGKQAPRDERPHVTIGELLNAEPRPFAVLKHKMSCHEQKAFLKGDYKIVRTVRDLPEAIQKVYLMRDGSRSALADPGEKYEVGDDIEDPYRPRRRLRFAGIAKDRVFVQYNHGGISNTTELDFFRMTSAGDVVGIWHGSSGRGDDLASLRKGCGSEGVQGPNGLVW